MPRLSIIGLGHAVQEFALVTSLERIQDEMVSSMVQPFGWVVVVPFFVVDRDSHFGRIAIVKAIGTAIVVVGSEVLGVVYIRIVIESVPVT